MGVHVNVKEGMVEGFDAAYIELFKTEMRKEIQVLKDKIVELETKLEDPFG